jgi:hypothetical protein
MTAAFELSVFCGMVSVGCLPNAVFARSRAARVVSRSLNSGIGFGVANLAIIPKAGLGSHPI